MSIPAFAQYSAVPSSAYPALDAILDAKPALTSGAGSPSSSCTTGKDIYLDTAAQRFYGCVATNTWSTLSAMLLNQANTGTAAQTIDISAATGSNAFKVPVKAGVTTTANGSIGYDATTNMLHGGQSAADAMIPQFTATPANNDCTKWVVSGSQFKLGTTGSACGAGGGATIPSVTNIINGDGAGNGADSGLAVAAVVTLTGSQTLTNKTLTAPVLGAATATTINKVTITAPATGSTLTVPDGVTLTGPASSGTVMALNQANTGTSAQTIDVSAATGSNALKVPVKASVTTTTNGAIGYDSTTDMLHAAQGAADAMIPQFTATPANTDCVQWVVSGSKYKLGTSGAVCGGGGGSGTVTSIATTSPITGGTITATGTIACATCVTSAAALTANGAMVGGGSQASQVSAQLTVANLGTPGTEAWTIDNPSLGSTPAGGFKVLNSTAAAAGVQQWSGPIALEGRGWKTTATAASQSVAYQMTVTPVQGTTAPTGVMNFGYSIAGAGVTNIMQLQSNGAVGLNTPQIIVGTNTGAGFSANGTYLLLYANATQALSVTNGIMSVTNGHEIGWSSTSVAGTSNDTKMTRKAAATIQHGAADAASPVAQAVTMQSVVAGTSNTAGQNFTLSGSVGTGTGVGGSLLFKVARAGSTGTTQNTLTTAFTIDGTSGAPIFPSFTFATLPTPPSNGAMVYCSDCVGGTFDASAAGSGSGTNVLYENGAWKVH